MSELDPRFEPWLRALRDEPVARPEALARLNAALRKEDALVARRVPSVSAAIAAAVALIMLASGSWLVLGRLIGRAAPHHAIEAEVLASAEFTLHAGGASSVSVVGDFNDWDPDATPLEHVGNGVWSAVVRLRPGTVRYSFIVDGSKWSADPSGVAASNDFGRPTSVAFIGRSGES